MTGRQGHDAVRNAVPPQARREVPPEGADPLEQADAYAVADAAGSEALLRCWVRETGVEPGPDGQVRLALRATGIVLRVPVPYWSAAGAHRFGSPSIESGAGGTSGASGAGGTALDAVTLAALLARESGCGAADGADLAARVADSVARTAAFLTERRSRPEPAGKTPPFLDAEQSLVLGHPLHPTPKSRQGLSEAEFRAYSPELRGSFPLHWLAVDRRVLAADSAWTARGRRVPAERITARLAGPGLRLPAGTVALPLHPWQAREVRLRPEVRRLFDAGLLHDLGPWGDAWHPTSSVRTVYRPGAPAMLKLSLAVRITNSRRENLRKELVRGVEVHRLLRSGLAERWHAAHPGFDVVRDPAWLAVDDPEGRPVPGLDVMVRHNPFGPREDVVCAAGLVAPRPWAGRPRTALRSRLADLVARLAARLYGAEFGKALRHEAASLDPASRQREHDEQRANRSLVMTQTPGGTLFKGRLDAVAGHKLAKAIDALCPRPALDDERTREQRHADALMVMVEHTLADRSTTPGAVAPVQAILTVDQATWAALRAEDWPRGEVAARTPGGGGEAEAASAGDLGPGAGSSGDVLPRLAGVPAVTDETGQAWPASEIARALCDCSLTRAVIGAESETLDLGRDSRLFKRRHWLALYAAGVRGCGIDGCGMPLAYCELHHVRWWYEHGGRTDLANCVPYCSFHHHEVHRRDLRVVRRADGSYEHRHPDGRRYGGAPRGDEHLAGCSPMPAVAGVRAGTGVPSAAPDDPPPADLLDLLPARPDDNGAERPGRRGSRGWHGAVVRVRDGTADTRGDGGVPPGVPSLVTS